MKKIRVEIKKELIEFGLFKYDFPQINKLDHDSVCFRIKQTLKCGNDVFLKKNTLIPFYAQAVAWGDPVAGVIFDFRKDGKELQNFSPDIFYVDFEYKILTKKKELERKVYREEQSAKGKEIIKNMSPLKRVRANLINLINITKERYNFFPEKENIEDILKNIDYDLIICAPETAEKYNVTTIVDKYLPPQIILCLKSNMKSAVIMIQNITLY